MKRHKFFNTDLKEQPTNSKATTNKTKTSISTIVSYIFLTILGISCIVGVIYYALEYFSSK